MSNEINNKNIIVSFPRMSNYHNVIYALLKNTLGNAKIIIPPNMTKRTIELGNKYSPDFVCTPFKYNLGNFIESLEQGATYIFQAGGGCRFGYYSELQEQILKDLGYSFSFITVFDSKGINLKEVFGKFKEVNPKLSFKKFIYYFLLAIKSVNYLDDLENRIREKIVFQKEEKYLENLNNELLEEIKNIKDFKTLKKVYKSYLMKINSAPLEKKDVLKIGIVGELYTAMEPFSTFNLEKKLWDMGIYTKRYTTVTYLLFEKGKQMPNLLKKAKKYITYELGADGTESVAHSLEFCELGYDGIIHTKPFGCIPEINAMSILNKMSQDYKIPILYFTFDTLTSEAGVNTRLEAFHDMMQMKKEAK